MNLGPDSETTLDIGGSGYSLQQLSDYLDAGRTPPITAIDDNAECQVMLDSLERLTTLSTELLAREALEASDVDETWLSSFLTTIGREVRAGKDIPFVAANPHTRLSITEGAVRELVRAAGDSVDGALVGSCSLVGIVDDSEPGATITVNLTLSVVLSVPVVTLAQAVRDRVRSELLKHTRLQIGAINVTVIDVHLLTTVTTAHPTGGML